MSWKPLLHFSFENHAALDETGHGFTGRVELPAADRWVDRPVQGIPTAVRFDHPQAKIAVPARPEFSGWRGLRVRAYFRIDEAPGRLNLVEGDGSFALFVEPGGVLRGTINDGSTTWWGVSSQPGRVHPEHWHFAELLYDSGQVLALSLDGQLLGVRPTAGLPVLPVSTNGILLGYWPGGDPRYTFHGLLGPVWIDTLDERQPMVEIANKLLCNGSDGTSRLEASHAIFEQELSKSEQEAVRKFGATTTETVKRLMGVVIGQARNPAATLGELIVMANDLGRLAGAHEADSTDLLGDPAFKDLLGQIYTAACRDNPAAPQVFLLEALKMLADLPLPDSRWKELVQRHPELCVSTFPPVDLSGAGGRIEDSAWIDDLLRKWCASQSRERPPEDDCPPARKQSVPQDRDPEAGQKAHSCEVHVHVHCNE